MTGRLIIRFLFCCTCFAGMTVFFMWAVSHCTSVPFGSGFSGTAGPEFLCKPIDSWHRAAKSEMASQGFDDTGEKPHPITEYFSAVQLDKPTIFFSDVTKHKPSLISLIFLILFMSAGIGAIWEWLSNMLESAQVANSPTSSKGGSGFRYKN